ncbi:MAG: hypothetical protein JSW07_02590 [bacterium]|nr:MAG: hypothetical protein JSW07_02590 [bacterium]
MKLTSTECKLFFDLYYPLLFYINQQRRIIADVFTIDGLRKKSSERLKSLREILYQQPILFDFFILQNPFQFSPDELEIVSSWKKWLVGRFFIFRETNYYTIFLSNVKPMKAYAVIALNREFSKIFPESLPIYIETALLPFKNKIITDGIFSRYRLEFGSGFIRNLHQSYLEAIDNEGIITSL